MNGCSPVLHHAEWRSYQCTVSLPLQNHNVLRPFASISLKSEQFHNCGHQLPEHRTQLVVLHHLGYHSGLIPGERIKEPTPESNAIPQLRLVQKNLSTF